MRMTTEKHKCFKCNSVNGYELYLSQNIVLSDLMDPNPII